MDLFDILLARKLGGSGGQATKPIIKPLNITENGTYTAPEGIDGYSPVTVNVKSGGDEELVITDFSYFCYREARIDVLNKLDTSNGTKFNSMFASSRTITSVQEFDTSNGTDFASMFDNCSKLISVPEFDTSKGTGFNGMFNGCSKLTSVPKLDLSNGTNFFSMFYGCTGLTSIPEFDTSNGTNFESMFNGCSKLTSVPEFDTSNGTSLKSMFNKCTALTSVPKLDASNCTNLGYVVGSCTNLNHLRIYNVKKALDISSCTALDVDSIVHTIKELHKVSSSVTLTLGATNLAKISDLYCRIIDDTTTKIDMELCDSAAEGAMTLVDYASEKGWNVQ